MEYGNISMAGGSERRVSRLVLGTALYGSAISRDAAFEMMDIFFEHGGNALDSARVYASWLPNGVDASERTVGEWIRSRGVEKEVFLITKGAHPKHFENMRLPRLSREEIESDIARSMEVLGTPIDLYFLHRDDRNRPVSDIMTTLSGLVGKGYVRAIGASNWFVDRIGEANAWADAKGAPRFTASQIQWSYADFRASVTDDTLVGMDEAELAGYEKMERMAVMAFSSQAKGVFSCGYAPDLSDVQPKHRAYVSEENIIRYQRLLAVCRRDHVRPERVALEYITKNTRVNGFAVIGASRKEQLVSTLTAME